MEKLLNIEDVCEMFQVRRQYILRLFHAGLLKGMFLGKTLKFRESIIDDFLKENAGVDINKKLRKIEREKELENYEIPYEISF